MPRAPHPRANHRACAHFGLRIPGAFATALLAACACSEPAQPAASPSSTASTDFTPAAKRARKAPSSLERPLPDRPGPQLEALQQARLQYMFRAAKLVQRDWPELQPDATCVMLIEPSRQWVVNCDLAPAGFATTSQRMLGHPVYLHEGGSFESGGSTRTTAELLATTPAAAHVPTPGSPVNGLPGTHPWLILGSLEALAQFHPAFEHATTEAWVSVAIHEFVHTHQLRAAGAERFIAEIVSRARTPSALTELFNSDPKFRARIEREYALLVRAAEAPPSDTHAARRALRRWLQLYARRVTSLRGRPDAAALVEDDALFSYIEGVARFVESEYLREPRYHPDHTALEQHEDPRFGQYEMFVGHGYLGSPNRQLDEHYFYAIGYHLCVLLDRLDPDWRKRIHAQKHWLYDLIRQVAAASG